MAEESKQPELRWVRAREVPEYYCNFTRASWTLFDVRVKIGQLVPSGEGVKDFVVEERAAVTFSWNQAKILARLLSELVASFEEVNGEIKSLKLAQDPGAKTQPNPAEAEPIRSIRFEEKE